LGRTATSDERLEEFLLLADLHAHPCSSLFLPDNERKGRDGHRLAKKNYRPINILCQIIREHIVKITASVNYNPLPDQRCNRERNRSGASRRRPNRLATP